MTFRSTALTVLAGACLAVPAAAETPPNIVVIWGDDVGQSRIGAYGHGLTGESTPNIDRLAREGMLFTDFYGEPNGPAGRAAFVTGQSVFRTGLGGAGGESGIDGRTPTVASLLKARGYATGHFGLHELGDRDGDLPTRHGFDVFFGNLYPLSADESRRGETSSRRGVIRANALGVIEDTGELSAERAASIDDETVVAALGFIEERHAEGQPFLLWWNGNRATVRAADDDSPVPPAAEDRRADGIERHDAHVGQIVDKLDALGIAANTIVIYSTDNGAELRNWPHTAITPFRADGNTAWEGRVRVPAVIRWPGRVEPGSVSDAVMHHSDWLPTLLAAAGDAEIGARLEKGLRIDGQRYKVHLDGYDFAPFLAGEAARAPRESLFYFAEDGKLLALRFGDWKAVFMAQRADGSLPSWAEPYEPLRVPLLINLRLDPYEQAPLAAEAYLQWMAGHMGVLSRAQELVAAFHRTSEKFPPHEKAAGPALDGVLAQLAGTGPQ